MSWSTSLGFGVWLGAVVAKSSRQSGPGLRNHTLIDLTSCPLQASVVPLYPPLRPVRTPNGMLSNQPSSAFSGPTNPPNFHGNREGLCQGQLQPSQEEHCASDASFEPRSTQDQQQHLTRQLHVGSFSQGFGPVHFFQPQFCPFHQLIYPPSIGIRTSHSSITHGTPDLSRNDPPPPILTAGTPASGEIPIPRVSQTRL